MTMVDWLLTEQLIQIFQEAERRRPGLNAELVAKSPYGEEDVLAGAGAAVRIRTRSGGELVVTPKRILRIVGDDAEELVAFHDLVGYDWIARDISDKVREKDAHYDRIYLDRRSGGPVVLDGLGEAVYPLMTFLGRVLEYQSQKVLRRKLDADLSEVIHRCLHAAARGPFFTDDELRELFGRDRASMDVVAMMWKRVNLAAPELLDLVERVGEALVERADRDPAAWEEWVGVPPEKVRTAIDVFGRIARGEV